MPTPNQKRKKQIVLITPFAELPNDKPDAIEVMIMSTSV